MLTMAIAWFSLRAKEYMPLLFIVSIIGDCTIVYYIVSAIAGKPL